MSRVVSPLRHALVALLVCTIAVVGGPVPAQAAGETEISGTITPPPGITGDDWLSRVRVTATTSPFSPDPANTATVDASGAFTITGLKPSQSYAITFDDLSGQAQSGWGRADGALAMSRNNSTSFTPGSSRVALHPQRAGTLAGQLDLSAVLPEFVHGDVVLWLYRESFGSNNDDGRINVSADGTFSRADLPAGESFYVSVNHRWLGPAWVTADSSLSVREDRVAIPVGTTGLQLTPGLETVRPGISGTITPAHGVDMSRVWLQAHVQSDSGTWDRGSMYQEKPQNDGSYFVGGLKADTSYRLQLGAPGQVLSGYVGPGGRIVRTIEEAADIPVGSTVDIHLTAAETLTGKVTVHPDVVRQTIEVLAYGNGSRPTAHLAPDDTFTVTGLWPGDEVTLAVDNRYPPSGKQGALGYVGEGGRLFPSSKDAAVFVAGTRGVEAVIEPLVPLAGTVELPLGFVHDAADAPLVEVLKQLVRETTYWVPDGRGEVGADGRFTVESTHPRDVYQLRLTWPDGKVLYWTSDRTVPTADSEQAGTTLPRRDVVFPVKDAPPPEPPPGTPPAPQPEEPPVPEPEAVAPRVTAKLVKKKTTRSKVRLKVKVRTSTTKTPVGKIKVRYATKTRTVRLKASHRGTRAITIPRVTPRGSATVRYLPTGSSGRVLTAARTKVKVTKVAPKVTVKTKKKISRGARATLVVRVKTPLARKPTGTVKIRYGGKSRAVKLKARAKGKVTVRLPRLSPGRHKVRVRYAPAKKLRPYLKTTMSRTVTIRVR